MNKFVEIKNNRAYFEVGSRRKQSCQQAYVANLASGNLDRAQQYERALEAFNKAEREALEATSRIIGICQALNGKLTHRADRSEFILLPSGAALILTPLPEGVKQRYVETNGKRAVLDLGQPLDQCMTVVYGLLAGPSPVELGRRLLEEGEIVREGDELRRKDTQGPWRPCRCTIGDVVTEGSAFDYLRRIEKPEWRKLEAGEVIQEGDQVQLPGGEYSPFHRDAFGTQLLSTLTACRRVTAEKCNLLFTGLTPAEINSLLAHLHSLRA